MLRRDSHVIPVVSNSSSRGTDEGRDMTSSLKQFKRRALSRPAVKAAYDASAEEFALLDEVLKSRAESALDSTTRSTASRASAIRGGPRRK
jgi:hypothetical protein